MSTTGSNEMNSNGNVNDDVDDIARTNESAIVIINRLVTVDSDAANLQPSVENTSAMQRSPADASDYEAPIESVERTSGIDGEENDVSPLTHETADSDPGPMKSTAGVAFEQNEDGVRFSVPVTESLNMTRNLDESTYNQGYDSDGERGPFYDAVLDEMDLWDQSDCESDDGSIFASPAIGVIQRAPPAPEAICPTPQPEADAAITAPPAPEAIRPTPQPEADAAVTQTEALANDSRELMTEQDLMKMTVSQLKQELEKKKTF
jgi:hypothetical protein